MITKLELKNFGPIDEVSWKKLGPINLVIGGNGNGKTFLLKSLYSAMRTLEEYKRGDDQRNAAEILAARQTGAGSASRCRPARAPDGSDQPSTKGKAHPPNVVARTRRNRRNACTAERPCRGSPTLSPRPRRAPCRRRRGYSRRAKSVARNLRWR